MAEMFALNGFYAGRKSIILMSSPPGAGKSFLANQLSKIYNATICSADHYFINEIGEYNFDVTKLGDAHDACQNSCRYLLSKGKNAIVDNTNTTAKEIKTYIELANAYREVNIIVARPNWTPELFVGTPTGRSWNIDFLLSQGTHNVPRKTLEKMNERYLWNYNELMEK